MGRSSHATATVEAEIRTELATAQIVRFDIPEPFDERKDNTDRFWIDLCLTPRPRDACACFPERRGAHRFERLGELFIAPPGEAMHARAEGGSQTSLVCQLEPGSIEKWFEGDLEWTSERLAAGLCISDRSIYGLLMRLTREVSHPGLASVPAVELIVSLLAIELARYYGSIDQTRSLGGLAAWRLRLIDERSRELGKAPSLEELAKLCNLSVRQLSRGFRISRGCSIGDYIEQMRLDNAKRLLVTGKSVKAVAYSLGFSSPQSFSFAFRRMAGISPAEYRQLA